MAIEFQNQAAAMILTENGGEIEAVEGGSSGGGNNNQFEQFDTNEFDIEFDMNNNNNYNNNTKQNNVSNNDFDEFGEISKIVFFSILLFYKQYY